MLSKITPVAAFPLFMILLNLANTSCARMFSGIVGQPAAMKGDIPLRVSNPPAVSEGKFAKPTRYSICNLTVVTPDGTGQGHSWFGGLVAPPPHAGESKDYKIKPGRYRVEATACMDSNTNDDSSTSRAHMDIDIAGPTEIVVVAPGVETPTGGPTGYQRRVLRTGSWKRCNVEVHKDGSYWDVCDK